MKKALIIVDCQNDFFPGGSLGVPEGDQIIPAINLVIAHAKELGWLIIVTRDWHPKETDHFKKLPPHCIKNTMGAKFHSNLRIPKKRIVISKGMSTTDDGYSPFEGTDRKGKSLQEVLQQNGITTLYVVGLATDYCVKACVLDALNLDYDTVVLTDAMKPVNIHPTDEAETFLLMRAAFAHLTNTQEVLNEKQ